MLDAFLFQICQNKKIKNTKKQCRLYEEILVFIKSKAKVILETYSPVIKAYEHVIIPSLMEIMMDHMNTKFSKAKPEVLMSYFN